MNKDKLFIKYEQVLNEADAVKQIVPQLIRWMGHFDQSLLNELFSNTFNHFNSNQFKQFIHNNKISALMNFNNPVAKEICLLVKLISTESADYCLSYIHEHLDLFSFIKDNLSFLDNQDKKYFIASIKHKYLDNLSYENLIEISKLDQSKLYGLTTIQHAFSCFDLEQPIFVTLEKQYQQKETAQKETLFFNRLNKTFSPYSEINIQMLDEFIQTNAIAINQFLGFLPNRDNLLNYLNLSFEQIQTIQNEQEDKLQTLKNNLLKEKETIRLEKEQEHQHRVWKKTLIHAKEVPSYLNIKATEFKRWREDGKIPIADTVEFKKWGRKLSATRHDPIYLKEITPETIEQWRKQDNTAKIKKTRVILESSKNKAQWTRAWSKQKKQLIEQNFYFVDNYIAKKYALQLELDGNQFHHELLFAISLNQVVKEKENSLIDFSAVCFEPFSEQSLSNQLKEKIEQLITTYIGTDIDTKEKVFVHESLALMMNEEIFFNDLIESTLESHIKKIHHEIISLRRQKAVRDVLNLDDYANNFPVARKLDRKIKLITGPTNSGKTFEALETLKKANSGVYLAPLRLLAMEIYDKLNADGIPCNLFTGEEHIEVAGAKHTSSTIEMVNTDKVVDVAVIDEFQMLKDPSRGWAWTAALTGVPAKQVFAVGSSESLEMASKLFNYLKEQTDVVQLDRKTQLQLTKDPVTVFDVQKNDIVVAFSRKDVLNIAAELRKNGLSVSVIYGSLSPEVRRKQSELFISGTTDVVVATDAIGMGLNLPAKRVIFSTVYKFDGKEKRKLLVSEIKQIAGRAGRFGLFEQGEYSAFSRHDLNYLKDTQHSPLETQFEKMQIAPSLNHVVQLKKHLGVTKNSIRSLIYYFSQEFGIQNSLFKNATLDAMIELSTVVDNIAPDLAIEDKYVCICAPVSTTKDDDLNYFKKAVTALKDKKEMELFSLPKWINDTTSSNLQQAENLSKNLSIYAWLSFKYKDIFFERDLIPLYRNKLSHYIASALVKEKSSFHEWWN